jgi:CheY-like chemotaxis protein
MGGIKILLAEDGDLNRKVLTERLEQRGYQVVPAGGTASHFARNAVMRGTSSL